MSFFFFYIFIVTLCDFSLTFTFLVGILGQAYSYNFQSMSLNLNQHVTVSHVMVKTSRLFIFHIPVLTYVHVTFTALKLLLIIILAIVYNKYTIPCLGALSEAFLSCWYFNCHSDEVINLWYDSCAQSKQNWSSFLHFLYSWTVQLVVRFEFFLTMKIHFVVSRLMTLCYPEECVVIIVALLIPSWVGGSMLLWFIYLATQISRSLNPQDLRLLDPKDEGTMILTKAVNI
jgi:hypothetical protein